MKTALVLSIAIKAIGALLEIANQVLIARFGGVELFGTFNFYVSLIEIVCWVCFSGIIKTNVYYISIGKDVKRFRAGFFALFALPLVILLSIVASLYSLLMVVAMVAALLYAYQMSASSVLLAFRCYKVSLIGEYIISRLVMIVGVVVLLIAGTMNETALIAVYALGFAVAVLYFMLAKRLRGVPLEKGELPELGEVVKKQASFQLTDVGNGLVNQAPVIVQFVFAGAFQAGVLSVILVAKKIISFIAGPTSKIYLPEFAKRYNEGDFVGLREVYREIVLLQMCFVLPICLIIMGAPDAVLSIYNPRLTGYAGYLQLAACIFFIMVAFGPQGNLLSMVGKEAIETRTKWVSIAVMALVMAATFSSDLFVLYGIAAQMVVDSFAKLYFVAKELGTFPISLSDWFKVLGPFTVLLVAARLLPFGMYANLGIVGLMALFLVAMEVLMFFGGQVLGFVKRKAG